MSIDYAPTVNLAKGAGKLESGDTSRVLEYFTSVSAVFTAAAAWRGFMSSMIFYANRSATNFGAPGVIVTIPALIAGIGAGLTSRVIAQGYDRESQKGVIQNA